MSIYFQGLALIGHIAEAKNAVNGLKAPMDRDLQGNAAMTLALAGDPEGAQNLAADLSRRFPDATIVRRCYVPCVQAALALNRGKPQEAIDSLFPLATYEMMNGMTAVYLRGLAYLAARKGEQAAAEFQKMLDRPSIDSYDVLRNLLPHLGLARAYAMQGDYAKARAAYQDFLELWKDADPDIPILKQAKAEYADLLKKERRSP